MKIRGNTVGTPLKPEKAVVKCHGLTDEEKATARQNIGAISLEDVGSLFEPVTQDEYDALVANGTVNENKYYLIVGDSQ